ncbi:MULTISPECIES: flagellar biosynthetic protein FliR [Tabrizicola]|uniref:flagellar biosynthetic protein FliR n=1 Tax=Tabrizicola TaxID=1443919 RepID=UPI001080F40D|nr:MULTISPECIES: flagellar biosynthetic protein FliR [Paracoccaceae]
MSGLIEELSSLLSLIDGVAWAAVLVFIRIGAMIAFMPGLGEPAVPTRVKLALILAFTLVLAPALAETISRSGPAPSLFPLAGEAVAGLILGIGMRLFLLALLTAAGLIAQASTLSQLFPNAAPEPQPAIGNLLVIAGVALALAAGLHVRAAELALLSYDVLPAGGYLDARAVADWNLSLVSRTFALGFSLAAPFVVASTIYNLALGAINRAMPHLMVAMVGAPALTLGAIALLAVSAPILLAYWLQLFEAYLSDPFGPPP